MRVCLIVFVIAAAACGPGSTADSPPSPTSGDTTQIAPEDSTTPDASTTEASSAIAGSCRTTSPATGTYALIDQTESTGIVDPLTGMHGHAAAWGDADGNGFPDLYVGTFADRADEIYAVRGATGPSPDRLLFGSGTAFVETSPLAALPGRTSGAVLVDLDADGDLDLVASRNAGPAEGPRGQPTAVFRNDLGVFTEVDSGFTSSLGGRSIGVFDYNIDGLADLFIVEDRYRGGSSRLFRNLGDLRFEDVTEAVGLPLDVNGLGVAVGDLGGDSRPDLFISGSNRLFVAEGDRFVEADTAVFQWDTFGDEDIIAGVDIADIDLDGRMDLVVGHHYNSTVDFDTEVAVRLYLNASDGSGVRFTDVTEIAGLVPLPTKAPHVEFADMNNDGLLDIVTSASAADGTLPAVFLGTGVDDGIPRFEAPSGLGSDQYWVAAPTADYNRDGRLDIVLIEWEPTLPSLLFSGRNDGNWIAVGLSSPTLAPAADVSVFEAGHVDDPTALLGHRPLSASRGYAAGSELLVHVGLGTIGEVDVVVTLVDGTRHEALGISANGMYLLPDGCTN